MNQPFMHFWGAARTVTGSMHLLETGSHRLLLDCGLFQGHRDEARQRNSTFPFDPHRIDAVILSHAHIDHCGNLPNLTRSGFQGPIYCTPATRDLSAVMLADSGKIQEEDAAYLNRQPDHKTRPIQPLYTRQDVVGAMRQFQSVPYDRTFDTGLGVRFRFVDAGHLLGSAMVHLTVSAAGREYALTFTGDLGRRGLPILRDPAAVPPAAFLISESTYGGKRHDPVEHLGDGLATVLQRTIGRKGKLLIPAFSLGRTQTVLYFLQQLITEGKIADLPIFVDSPLAADATEVFRLHPECFDDEASQLLDHNPDLFGKGRIHYTRTVEESKRLNDLAGPCVIIASSGMCEAGRILHHLKHGVADSRNTVLIIGFQAPDTLGQRIADHQREVRILDQLLPVRAEVVQMNGFSSHADHAELLTLLGPLASQTRQVCLVHGELPSAQALAEGLAAQGFRQIAIPERGQEIPLV
jgi:metallo-beta-lactamase family protein